MEGDDGWMLQLALQQSLEQHTTDHEHMTMEEQLVLQHALEEQVEMQMQSQMQSQMQTESQSQDGGAASSGGVATGSSAMQADYQHVSLDLASHQAVLARRFRTAKRGATGQPDEQQAGPTTPPRPHPAALPPPPPPPSLLLPLPSHGGYRARMPAPPATQQTPEDVALLQAVGAGTTPKPAWRSTADAAASDLVNAARVADLLKKGASPRAGEDAALVAAARHGSAQAVALLLEAGADAHAMLSNGDVALRAACAGGHADTAAVLLAADTYSERDLNAALVEACNQHRNVDAVVEHLLQAGVVPTASVLGAALLRGCETGDLTTFDRLLAHNKRGCCVSDPDSLALTTACTTGHIAIVQRLIATGIGSVTKPGVLAQACRGGKLEVVDLLLAHWPGADGTAAAAATAAGGRTTQTDPMYAACEGGHLDVVDRLLAAAPTVLAGHVDVRGDAGVAAVSVACAHGHLAVVERLLASGAHVLPALPPAHWQPDQNAFCRALNAGNAAMVAALWTHLQITHGPWLQSDAHAVLYAACSQSHAPLVTYLLTEILHANAASASATAAPPPAVMARALAEVCGGATSRNADDQLAVIDLLLAAGAEADADDCAALRRACERRNVAVVERLFVADASMLTRRPGTAPALFLAMVAVGDTALVQRALVLARARDLDLCTTVGGSALRIASENDDPAMVRLLLEAGADTTGPDAIAALATAYAHGQADSAMRLAAAGVKVTFMDQAQFNSAVTRLPLDAATTMIAGLERHAMTQALITSALRHLCDLTTATARECGLMDALLQAGAQVSIANYVPLRSASARGHVALVERLLAAGANVHAFDDDALVQASSLGHAPVVTVLLAKHANVHAQGGSALVEASANGHATVVNQLLAGGADIHAYDDAALTRAIVVGHVDVACRLVAAYSPTDAADRDILSRALGTAIEQDLADLVATLLASRSVLLTQEHVRLASRLGRVHVTARLLAAGAPVRWIQWGRFTSRQRLWILVALRGDLVPSAPDDLQALWRRYLERPLAHLRAVLHVVRYKLDRPPNVPLGPDVPTRASMIAHLRTGGRRFAREYWTEGGLPLFFPNLDLGPCPF